ncbi:HNH endonuclease [Roseomonas sp. USHLN139]|uniref:HNH endonuclease n=1 Tax=Roseomonas sp. USHLN139 TaxID=3081298 RepID=UPI003B02D492
MKTCTKCGETKPLEAFSRHSEGRLGRRPDCKACKAEQDRAWRAANALAIKPKKAAYYRENKDALEPSRKAWRTKNSAAIIERVSEWQEENRDRVRACHRAWAARNPDVRAGVEAKRRARKREAQVEPVGLLDVIARDGLSCYICERLCDPRAPRGARDKAVLEHVVPLASGGTHTMANLRLACDPCNTVKGYRRTPEETRAIVLANRGRGSRSPGIPRNGRPGRSSCDSGPEIRACRRGAR